MMDPADYEFIEDVKEGLPRRLTRCGVNIGTMDNPEGCGDKAVDQDLFDGPLCRDHTEQAMRDEAEEVKLERQLAARDNHPEYPRFYDGTGVPF